jgi:O-antigen/teichoic acid export membrane protein
MSDIPPAAPAGAGELDNRSARGVAIAGVIVAASGFVIQALVSRTAPAADTALFLVFWSLLFGVVGITGGIQNESTRAVRAAQQDGAPPAAPGARVVVIGLAVGTALAALVAVSSPLWASHVLQEHAAAGVALVALAAIAFSGHASVTGALAGMGSWAVYARVVALESTLRFVLVVVVVAVSATLFGLMVAASAATGAWLLALATSRRTRAALTMRADRPARAYVAGLGHAIIASASTAVLVVGFPVLIQLTTDDDVVTSAAPLLLAISLTRAPLLLPLNTFQGVAIAHFVQHPERRARTLGIIVGIVAAAGCVGAALAWLAGPTLMDVVLHQPIDGAVLAALTGAGALMALITLTGTAVLALGRHRAYSAGWAVASVLAVLLLLPPWPLEQRVLLSLWVSPLTGAAIHAIALFRSRPDTPRP